MGRLAEIVPIRRPHQPVTEAERLRAELQDAHDQIGMLTGTVADQAKTLAAVTDDCPPWAPSLAIVYWLYGPTRWADAAWTKTGNHLRHLVRDIGDLPAPKLTPIVWEQHRARRRMEPTVFRRPPGEALLNNALTEVKAMLKWAVANKLIRYSPLAHAKAVKTISRRETWLAPRELDRLLEACPLVVNRTKCRRRSYGKVFAETRNRRAEFTVRWYEVVPGSPRLAKRQQTGFETRDAARDALARRLAILNQESAHRDDGWRASVLRAFVLCCHDSMLRFNEARTLLRDRIGPDGRVEFGARQTKGRKRRVVFLTPRTLAAIAEIPVEPGNPYVFAHRPYGQWSLSIKKIGGPVGDKRLSTWFRRLCEVSGIDAFVAPGERRLHAHDLRASGASTADEMGARPTAIRDALGHSSLAITQIYLRSGQADNARTVSNVLSKLSDGTKAEV
jgi:site-specific recombinase XerD